MDISFRLLSFNIKNKGSLQRRGEKRQDNKKFIIQIFGMNAAGKTFSVLASDFKPFFYVKIAESTRWNEADKIIFHNRILRKIGKDYYAQTLYKSELVEKKTLYGFDADKSYQFVKLTFANTTVLNKVKRLWYDEIEDKQSLWGKSRILKEKGYLNTQIYETAIPPLLRYFHIQNISPSGWVKLNNPTIIEKKSTSCDYEYKVAYHQIEPILSKELQVPLKICSFDIEASSSHGDFPLPKKSYKKLVIDILDYWDNNDIEDDEDEQKRILRKIILHAFFGSEGMDSIHRIHPKEPQDYKLLNTVITRWLKETVRSQTKGVKIEETVSTIEDGNPDYEFKKWWKSKPKQKDTILDILNNPKFDRGDKLTEIDKTLVQGFPDIEGDKVTFIGSTFLRLGEQDPYMNHCVALNTCDNVSGVDIEWYAQEKDVLLAWRDIIQKEDPDIIIGYNINGFDFKFMIDRADELGCKDQFLRLGRTQDENGIDDVCNIKNSSIKIASGIHELRYIEMTGRIIIDLYNYFRREVNLSSYKLDNVASHFIGDFVHGYEFKNGSTRFLSRNLMGLKNGNYIRFEEISHSTEAYEGGKKFIVFDVNEQLGEFKIKGDIHPDNTKKIRWCLAKDDVSPQDIFRLSNGTASDRAIVAKYCIQDCNLVHYLMIKNDILTGFIEIASICSVPISFIVLRGQGIKLLSFIAKICRQKNILIPDINKGGSNEGYEGAICLPPKCDLYLDNPVAVVDYSSLYPSSMISENISHDSKVWTKEYDLNGKLLKETGSTEYDNLDEYQYVDIEYDTYKWIRKREGGREIKTKVGTKICRFAQFPDNKKAVMPSILVELLSARKATRVLIKYKTVTTCDGQQYSGLLTKKDGYHFIKLKDNSTISIEDNQVQSVEDTYNDFMKNVFDKRQQGYKITANSLYGQCGGKTSSFYDKDIAASTTATGRKLLIYAKQVIEGVYKNRVCDTSHGRVTTNADCIYGDSVTGDTPIFLKHIKTGKILFKQIDNIGSGWFSYEGFKVEDMDRYSKEQCLINEYEVWTSKGWSNIRRLIRHKTNKKLYRVTTHTGMVDVTEDHSLLDENHQIIKPNDAKTGMHLLHYYPTFKSSKISLNNILNYIKTFGDQSIEEKKAFIYGFFYGDGSCGKYNCPSGIKYSWALNNKDIELCVILQSLLEEIYEHPFKILDTIQSSGVYKVVPIGKIKEYVEEYRPLFYNKDRYKQVPVEILNAEYNIQYAYFAGYYAADGSKSINSKNKNIRMCNKGKIGSAGLFYLAKSLGLNVSINTRKDKQNIISLKCSSYKLRKHPHELKKVEYIGNSEDNYVYDIETETGDFNTGFPLIVKNTDSCFFTFNLEDLSGNEIRGKRALEITIELAQEAGAMATSMLKGPHDLEYEKTFMPFALLSKKRYVGMLYEMNPNKCKRKSMGIVLKRRDNAPIVKDIYGGVIDILMKKQNIQAAVDFTRTCLQDMIDEKYPMRKLIITKSLRGFYKNPRTIAHKVLAERMGKRDPGTKPSIGSRVPFAYIQTKGKRLQGDKIEHPDFIKKHKLRLDYGIYITNQIMKPIQQIFALPYVLDNMPAFRRRKRQFNREIATMKEMLDSEKFLKKSIDRRNKEVKRIIFEDFLRKAENKKQGHQNIKSFFGNL